MKRLYFLLVFLFVSIIRVHAVIDVSVSYNDFGDYPGKIIVVASGTAGPFEILVLDIDGQVVDLSALPPLLVAYSYEWLCANLADEYWLVGTVYEQHGNYRWIFIRREGRD